MQGQNVQRILHTLALVVLGHTPLLMEVRNANHALMVGILLAGLNF